MSTTCARCTGRPTPGDAERRPGAGRVLLPHPQYVGAYLAVLGGCDALVFTAGVGENAARRAGRGVCAGLERSGHRARRRAQRGRGRARAVISCRRAPVGGAGRADRRGAGDRRAEPRGRTRERVEPRRRGRVRSFGQLCCAPAGAGMERDREREQTQLCRTAAGAGMERDREREQTQLCRTAAGAGMERDREREQTQLCRTAAGAGMERDREREQTMTRTAPGDSGTAEPGTTSWPRSSSGCSGCPRRSSHHANRVRPNPSGLKVGGHQASSASMVVDHDGAVVPRSCAARTGCRSSRTPRRCCTRSTTCSASSTSRYLTTLREFGGLQSYPSRVEGPGPGRLLHRLGRHRRHRPDLGRAGPPLRRRARRPAPGTGRQYSLVGDAELDEGAVLGGDPRPDGRRARRGRLDRRPQPAVARPGRAEHRAPPGCRACSPPRAGR